MSDLKDPTISEFIPGQYGVAVKKVEFVRVPSKPVDTSNMCISKGYNLSVVNSHIVAPDRFQAKVIRVNSDKKIMTLRIEEFFMNEETLLNDLVNNSIAQVSEPYAKFGTLFIIPYSQIIAWGCIPLFLHEQNMKAKVVSELEEICNSTPFRPNVPGFTQDELEAKRITQERSAAFSLSVGDRVKRPGFFEGIVIQVLVTPRKGWTIQITKAFGGKYIEDFIPEFPLVEFIPFREITRGKICLEKMT